MNLKTNFKYFKIAINKINRSKSTKGKVARGGLWLSTGSGVEQLLKLLRNVLLTRLLLPDALGIMSIILVINNGIETFTNIGIKEVLIQNKRSESDEFKNSVWWISATRSLAIYLFCILSVPILVKIFNVKFSIDLLKFSFLSILFHGLISPNAFISLKRLNYSKWVLISQGGSIFGTLLSIILALVYRSPWAIVIGYVCESFFKTILSYVICPFVPKVKIDKASFCEIVNFSKGMFGQPILFFLYQSVDMLVVSRSFSITEVGLYGMARSLARTPNILNSVLLNPILMPLFSRNMYNNSKKEKMILSSTFICCSIGAPLIFFNVFMGKEVLSLIYGSAYSTVAIPFSIIFSTTIIQICCSPITVAYIASGKPQMNREFTLFRTLIMLILIIPLTKKFGLIGSSLAGLLSMSIPLLFQEKRIKKISTLKFSNYLKTILSPMIGSFISYLCIFPVLEKVQSNHLKISLGIFLCIFLWALFLWPFLKSIKLRLNQKTLKNHE